MELAGASPEEVWVAVRLAASCPVVGLVPPEARRVDLTLIDEPLGSVLDRVADALECRWRLVGQTIVFGPPEAPPPGPPRTFADRARDLVGFFESLRPSLLSNLLRGRLLPIRELSQTERDALASGARGYDQLPRRAAETGGVPCVGVFFHPFVDVYPTLDGHGIDRGMAYGLMEPMRAPGKGPMYRVIPPTLFTMDPEGYLVPKR